MFPDELRVSSFPDTLPHYACTAAQSAHFGFDRSRAYACLGVTCDLHLRQNDRGLLCATAITRGGTDTEQESAHKVNSGKENVPAAPAGIRTRTLSITLYQQANPACWLVLDDILMFISSIIENGPFTCILN